MKEIEIGYLTENPAPEYAKAIRAAKTKRALVKAIEPYRKVAEDALESARLFSDADFNDFKRDIIKASKIMPAKWVDEFNRRFGAVAMPMKLVFSTLVADQFKAPWGAAFIRCEEEGWPMLNTQTK